MRPIAIIPLNSIWTRQAKTTKVIAGYVQSQDASYYYIDDLNREAGGDYRYIDYLPQKPGIILGVEVYLPVNTGKADTDLVPNRTPETTPSIV